MNIQEAIKQGRDLLQNQNLPQLESEILLAHILQTTKEFLIAHPEKELSKKEETQFISLCQERKNGKPIEHLTNLKEFFGIELFIDDRALIPRPETELLVEEVLKYISNHEVKQIIEVGTGSGNISIAIAKNTTKPKIIAGEFSPAAIKVARKNVEMHELTERIELRESNLLQSIAESADIIVANLPYIGKETNNFVSQEAANHEPHVALFGGNHGLELYEELFQQITARKTQPKLILGEFGFSQGQKMQELLDKYFSQKNSLIKQDLAGLDRYFTVQ